MPSAAGRALSQPYLDALLAAAPFGVALYDTHLRCVRANTRLAGLTGVTPEDFVGQPAGWRVPGPFAEKLLRSRLHHVLRTGESLRDRENIIEAPTEPGLRMAYRTSYEPVRDEHGTVVGVVVLVQDLTVQAAAQVEAAAVHARADLADRLRMKLANVALDPREVAGCLSSLLTDNDLAAHCVVLLVDPDSDRLETMPVASVDDAGQHAIAAWLDERAFRSIGPIHEVLINGRSLRFTAPDVDGLADQLGEPYRELVRTVGVRSVMATALRAQGEIFGVLAVSRDEPYTIEDQLLVEQMNDLAGIVLDNARLLHRHRRYLAVVEAMAGRLTLGSVYEAVLPVLREVLNVDTVRLLLLSADGSHLYSGVTIGLEAEQIRERIEVGESFAGHVAAAQHPLVIEDAERAEAGREVFERTGLRGLAGVPVADHELLGVLLAGTRRTRRFSHDDLELLQLTADRLALAVRQDETEQALQRSAAFSRSVLDHVVDAVITVDERGIVTSVNPATVGMFGYEADELVGQPVTMLMPEPDRSSHNRSIARYLETGEARILGTVREVWARRRDGTVFPVEIGVSEVTTAGRQRFFTGVIHDVTVRQRTQDELRHQALHDPLTGLPNRVLFGDHLDEALARSSRSGAPVGLLLVDLDRFKPVNDTLGHPAGDEVLRQAAERLRTVLRPSDTVARLGGDEFGVVVQDARRDEDVVRVARRIHQRFAVPFVVEGQQVRCTASIGVAQSNGWEPPAEMLRHADAALYLAKERGRNRYELFDEPLRSRMQSRVRYEDELSRAIEAHQLEPWFQPILDLRANRIVAVEMLARWRHPERGLVEASEVMAVAEDSGLIVALGADLAGQARLARDRWAAPAGGHAPDLTINLSAQELNVTGASGVLGRLACAPGHLWVELGEDTLMQDSTRMAAELAALRSRGVRVAVDRFGTGRTSIGRLSRDTADAIKIDRSFVAGFGTDRAATGVVEGAVGLGRALDLDVVAVGVERVEQLDGLRRLGCTHAQGYAIGTAVAADDVPALVRSWR